MLIDKFKQQEIFNERASLIDTWGNAQLIASLHLHDGTATIPDSGLIQSRGSITSFDFVIQAFEELKTEYHKAYLAGKIHRKSLFSTEFKCFKSYEDPLEKYNTYTVNLLDQFINSYIPQSRKQLNSFNEFFKLFLVFISENKITTPITLEGFLSDQKQGSHGSGLVLDYFNRSYNDLDFKLKLLEDPNFVYFSKLAFKHGFRIDQVIPWKLVVDLAKIKSNTFTSVNSFIDQYYLSVSDMFQTTINLLLISYGSYYRSLEDRCQAKSTPDSDFSHPDQLSGLERIELYLQLRLAETQKKLDQDELDSLRRTMYALMAAKGTNESIRFINQRIYNEN